MSNYITLQQAKAHLRVDFDNDDIYIQDLVSMVEEFVIHDIQGEAYYTISGTISTAADVNLTGEGTMFTNYKPGDIIKVEGDTSRIIATITDDLTGTVTVPFSGVLSDAKYRAYTGIPQLKEDGTLPRQLKQAMLILLGHFYMLREPVMVGVNITKVPFSYDMLIGRYKHYTIA